jgi:hypothetical protein
MNTFSLHQATLPWWVEVYMSVSQQTYQLGPFKSQQEAKRSRGAHVEVLLKKETRDIIASIKQQLPHSFSIGEPLC